MPKIGHIEGLECAGSAWDFPNGWSVAIDHHAPNCSGFFVAPRRFSGSRDNDGIAKWLSEQAPGDRQKFSGGHLSDKDLATMLSTVAGWETEPGWNDFQKAKLAGNAGAAADAAKADPLDALMKSLKDAGIFIVKL